MSNKVSFELDQLFHDVVSYRQSQEYLKLLEFVKKFPHLAPYNAMLLHIQKPGSIYVCSASEWRDKFKRTIKPGARPLVTLRAFGPVSFVFEYDDTEGSPLPKELIDPFEAKGTVSDDDFKNLINNLKCDGISYYEADNGTASAGLIRSSGNKREATIIRKNKEIRVKVLCDMIVNKNSSLQTRFATILHELAHAYCGHLGIPDATWWDDRSNHDKYEKEFEAESVCWLVCERLGIQNPSAAYLSGYLGTYGEIPEISVDTVLKATGLIESLIHHLKEPRKEIIVSINGIPRKAN